MQGALILWHARTNNPSTMTRAAQAHLRQRSSTPLAVFTGCTHNLNTFDCSPRRHTRCALLFLILLVVSSPSMCLFAPCTKTSRLTQRAALLQLHQVVTNLVTLATQAMSFLSQACNLVISARDSLTSASPAISTSVLSAHAMNTFSAELRSNNAGTASELLRSYHVITCLLMGLFYNAFSCGFEFVIHIPKSICFGYCCVSPYSVGFESCTVHSKCLLQIRHKSFKIFRPNICHRLNSLASLA